MLRKISCLFLALLGGLTPLTAADLRLEQNFNRDWKFDLEDPQGAQTTAFNDSGWQPINLPHSFSLPYFASDKFYVGYGWYRKQFAQPSEWAGKRVNLEFDGVFQVAEVFVNGTRVGVHKGGYTGFSLDITSALKPGTNLIALRVNNVWSPRIAPRAGEHVFSGGIYRGVRLVVTDPVHVAWYGTCVSTPQVSPQGAIANIKTEIVNDSATTQAVTVKTFIQDPAGNVVASMDSTQNVAASGTAVFDQTSRPILNPKLWHPDHPYLYSVKTVVIKGGKPVDDYTSPLGFRSIKFTADNGFFINGEHLYLKGANVHQDHAGWGDAVADSGFYRDVKLLKDAGFFFIRGSHYAHAPAFASACDELGVLFWSENCFWGIGGYKPDGDWASSAYPPKEEDQAEFEDSVKQQLAEMIRINRNHPSIIAWSMGNETFFSVSSVMPKVKQFLGDLVAYSHQLDPTRPAAIGGVQRPLDGGRLDKVGDIAGYNGDGCRQAVFQNPGIPSVVGEYGSTAAVRPGKYEPGWGDLGRDQGKEVYPWRSGQAIWCMFDHGSIAGTNLSRMGIVDYFRLPKRAWYWYRNEYKKIPPPKWPSEGRPAGLKLTADKPLISAVGGTDDTQVVVTIVDQTGQPLSNSPAVTLKVESGPGEFPTGQSITFEPNSDIAIRDGQAAIEMRAYYAGRTVIRASSPGLRDATLVVNSVGGPAFIEGKSPVVMARPYVRFTGGSSPSSSAVMHLGLQNPTRASSETQGHNAALANDGNSSSFWQADATESKAWWRVDLEKRIAIQSVKLTFPSAGNWRYRIEASEDGETGWKPVGDETQTSSVDQIRNDKPATPVTARFLRVFFTACPLSKSAGLSEVEVLGTFSTN